MVLILHLLAAQSPITIPYPEKQFYGVPISKELVDIELDSILQYNYNSTTKTWNKGYKYNFYYDANGFLVNAIKWYWKWDELYWKGDTKMDFQYTDNRLTKSMESFWWNDSANWVKRYINNYEYINDAIVETKFYHYVETAEEVKYQKRQLYYNQNWLLTLERIYDFIAFDQTYDESEKITYKYDSKNRLIEYIDYSNYFYWEVHSKDVYTFNDDSCTILDIHYNSQNSVLTEFMRSLDKCIFKNDQLERVVTYDVSYGSELDISANPVMDSYDFKYENGKLLERINYMGIGSFNGKIECFYSPKNITDQIQTTKIYPNPCLNDVNIEQKSIKRIDLYNLNGVLVISKNCNSSNESQKLNISNLQRGMYLLMITKENGLSDKMKIIKN
jgi:hypothetical protein